MYLSKFKIDVSHPSARQALCNVQDFHRNLMARFEGSRQEAGVLYRMDLSKAVVYVLSKDRPHDIGRTEMKLLGSSSIDLIFSSMSTGKQFNFDIFAVPSKKIAKEGKKNSQRITLPSEEERIEWMQRKAKQAGFTILTIQELNEVEAYGKHGADNAMRLCGYHYQGRLVIDREERFRQAYCEGIGPEKAYGYGMLLLM